MSLGKTLSDVLDFYRGKDLLPYAFDDCKKELVLFKTSFQLQLFAFLVSFPCRVFRDTFGLRVALFEANRWYDK